MYKRQAVYRVQKITKPIRESDTLAVAEMNLNSFRGDVEMNDLQPDASTELYQALEEYLGKKLYLPLSLIHIWCRGSWPV